MFYVCSFCEFRQAACRLSAAGGGGVLKSRRRNRKPTQDLGPGAGFRKNFQIDGEKGSINGFLDLWTIRDKSVDMANSVIDFQNMQQIEKLRAQLGDGEC